jgi:hypothetical protein
MMNVKNIVMLTALVGALTTSVNVCAEPMPPKGTTVNTIPLTTVETNVKTSSGQMMPGMASMPSDSMNNGMANSGMNNNMGTPMTSDMNMSDSSATPSASERMPDTMNQPTTP